jgi:hypothetical protein
MLTETSTHSALASGRWVRKNRICKTIRCQPESIFSRSMTTLERYQMGETSLGSIWTFRPDVLLYRLVPSRIHGRLTSCRTQSEYNNNKNRNNTKTGRSLHVLFIGDSFRLQQDMFDRFFGQKLKTTQLRRRRSSRDTTEHSKTFARTNCSDGIYQKHQRQEQITLSFSMLVLRPRYKFVKVWRKHRAPLIHNVSDIDFSCPALP